MLGREFFFETRMGDGAKGEGGLKTLPELMAAHSGVPEALVLTPDGALAVYALHLLHGRAGADVLQTDSFTANKSFLSQNGLGDRTLEINLRAGKLALAASEDLGGGIAVVGSIGPICDHVSTGGSMGDEQVRKAHIDQILGLQRAGVHGLNLETFISLDELAIVLSLAMETTDLPIIVTMSFNSYYKETASGERFRFHRVPLDGTSPAKLVVFAGNYPGRVIAVGANCGVGPKTALALLRRFNQANRMNLADSNLPIDMKINAAEGPSSYVTEACMGQYAGEMKSHGATIIGGCCGTTPFHLRAMGEAMGKPQRGAVIQLQRMIEILHYRKPGDFPGLDDALRSMNFD